MGLKQRERESVGEEDLWMVGVRHRGPCGALAFIRGEKESFGGLQAEE